MIYLGLAMFLLYLIFKILYIFYPLCSKNHSVLTDKVSCYKSFALLIPAYNEEHVILNCINSLKVLPYPNYRVYIIDDGSADKTIEILSKHLLLMPARIKEDVRLQYQPILAKYRSGVFPHIYVISKKNGGKADSLNAGIACCRQEIVITLDADCMLKEDALSTMNKVFQNEKVVAAGGTVHITQSISACARQNLVFGLKNLIKYQVMQYLNAFYLQKFTQSCFRSLVVISGAYGAFARNLLITLGGYRRSVGEDMDITLKIHQFLKSKKNKYIMTYVPQSVCYTECPESIKNLTKQRIRWQKAIIDCTVNYGCKMFRQFNPGISFFFTVDYFFLGTLTCFIFLLTPLSIILGSQVSYLLIALFSTDIILGIIECIISKKVAARYNFKFSKNDSVRLGLFIGLKMFIFKFLNIFFTVIGTLCYFSSKDRWNKAERLGRCFAGTDKSFKDNTEGLKSAASSVNNS